MSSAQTIVTQVVDVIFQLSDIKDEQERKDKRMIVEATNDVIDTQTNPIDRVLMIEQISEFTGCSSHFTGYSS